MLSPKNKSQSKILTRLHKLPEIVLLLLALVFLAGSCSKFGWLCNLPSHFVLQFAALFFLTACWFMLERKFAHSIISVAFFICSILKLAPYLIHSSEANSPVLTSGSTIRFLQMNVLKHNPDISRIASVIQQENADLLSMEELNDRILQGLKSGHTLDQYPYSAITPNDSPNSEIALFSKYPIISQKIEHATSDGDPSIIAQIQIESSKSLTIIVMHPRPPATAKYLERQEAQFTSIAKAYSDTNTPLIVAGDLNTSPWAQPYKDFVNSMHLVDPRTGRGLLPTWPTYFPLLAIPIDHILCSKNIKVSALKTSNFTGSDHLPLLMEFSL